MKKLIVAFVISALLPSSSSAGDLLGDFLDNQATVTAALPGNVSTSTGGYLHGGSFNVRTPTGSVHPITVSMPSVRGGCGGISATFGGLSYMNMDQLGKQITMVAQNAGYMIAMVAYSEVSEIIHSAIGDTIEKALSVNKLNMDACAMAKPIALALYPPTKSKKAKESKTEADVSASLDGSITNYGKWQEKVNGTGGKPVTTDAQKTAACYADAAYASKLGVIMPMNQTMLQTIATREGWPAEWVPAIRGLVGDVRTSMNLEGNITPKYMEPCKDNVDGTQGLLFGTLDEENSVGVCSASSFGYGGVEQYLQKKIADIKAQQSARAALTPAQVKFLSDTAMPYGEVLKIAAMTGMGDRLLSDIIATDSRRRLYSMLDSIYLSVLRGVGYVDNQSDSIEGEPAKCHAQPLLSRADTKRAKLLKQIYEVRKAAAKDYVNYVNTVNLIKRTHQELRLFRVEAYRQISKAINPNARALQDGK